MKLIIVIGFGCLVGFAGQKPDPIKDAVERLGGSIKSGQATNTRSDGKRWAKEPDGFRGVRFLATESEARQVFEIQECSTYTPVLDQTCMFEFLLDAIHIRGMLLFQNDRMVGAISVFPQAEAVKVREILETRYGQPTDPVGSRWVGTAVSLELAQTTTDEQKKIIEAFAMRSYERDLGHISTRYRLRMDSALAIFKLNYNRYDVEVAKAKAEKESSEGHAEAKRSLDELRSTPFSSFSLMTNQYRETFVKRKEEAKKKNANVL